MSAYNDELEIHFLYRLIKLLYMGGLLLGVIIFLVVNLSFPSSEIPDDSKSNLVCGDYIYNLAKNNLYLQSYSKELSYDARSRVESFCGKDKKIVYIYKKTKLSELNKDEASVLVAYEPRDWSGYFDTLGTSILVLSIFYVVSSLFKEALIYLFFGIRFKWEWLRNIYDLVNK